MTAFALNEWETQEWRQKVDTQKGSLLATQLKNNSFKLAKWAAQSILAGADLMKIGCVRAGTERCLPTGLAHTDA